MHRPEQFTLIGSLEPITSGDTFNEWPLHVTVLPKMDIKLHDRNAFFNAIQTQANVYHHIRLVGEEAALYGPEHNIPVRLVHSDALITLHHDLLETLAPELRHAKVDPTYIGDNYSPYVTYVGERGIGKGEVIAISALQLIAKKRNGLKRVAKAFLCTVCEYEDSIRSRTCKTRACRKP